VHPTAAFIILVVLALTEQGRILAAPRGSDLLGPWISDIWIYYDIFDIYIYNILDIFEKYYKLFKYQYKYTVYSISIQYTV